MVAVLANTPFGQSLFDELKKEFSMENEFRQIRETLNRLDTIQMSHIESFDTTLMPDLEHQLSERTEAFDKLKKQVNRFIANTNNGNTADTESMTIGFIDRINTLIAQNKVLEKRVTDHRDGLQKSLKKISRGKKAIGSYGSPSSVSNRPRAINLTN
jgi:DNA-directed RNA polymerase beta' subunit